MTRADLPRQPLKAKQRALLDTIKRLQPVTIRGVAQAIHGDDDPLHIRMIHNQVPALQSRGLITPAGVAKVAPGTHGIRPLLWIACD